MTDVARRRGRAAGIAVFAVIVTAFTAVCSAQILWQVWAPEVTPTDVECRPGAVQLVEAVHRARSAAAATGGYEREALARFRSALEPEWTWRPALEIRCHDDPEALRALQEIDRFRYAEEHAVRYDAASLSRLRRRMKALQTELHQ
jgi:hypothetical protein